MNILFEDYNHPGVVYSGTEADMADLASEGGFPRRVNPARVRADGLVEMPECVETMPDGRCVGRRLELVRPKPYRG